MGGAGIVGLVGGFGGLAYVQRTRRSVLSYGARGDGSQDDGPAIRAALSDPRVSEVEFPAVEDGYHVDVSVPGWEPLPLRSGHRLCGSGAEGTIVRAGALTPAHNRRALFANEDFDRGIEDAKIRDLSIEGRREDLDLKNEFDLVLTAFLIRSKRREEEFGDSTGISSGFELSNCHVRGWPGVPLNASGLEDFQIVHNLVEYPLRGGLIFNFWNRSGSVSRNEVYDAGDDAIAFNADGNAVNGNSYHPQRAPSNDVLVAHNRLSRVTERPSGFTQPLAGGPVVAVRSGKKIRLYRNEVLKGGEEAMVIERRPKHDPIPSDQISLVDNELRRCLEGALIISAESVRGHAKDNLVENCGSNPYRNAAPDTFKILT